MALVVQVLDRLEEIGPHLYDLSYWTGGRLIVHSVNADIGKRMRLDLTTGETFLEKREGRMWVPANAYTDSSNPSTLDAVEAVIRFLEITPRKPRRSRGTHD